MTKDEIKEALRLVAAGRMDSEPVERLVGMLATLKTVVKMIAETKVEKAKK